MSKELEALQQIKASHFQAHIESKNIADFDIWFEEYYNLLLKALTPPTADEVCKALSEYYGRKVVFRDNAFWYKTIIFNNEIWVREVSLKDLSKDNRGDLITLIGRFYEGLEAKE